MMSGLDTNEESGGTVPNAPIARRLILFLAAGGLVLCSAGPMGTSEEPRPRFEKPRAPIDATLTLEPAGSGQVRLTLKATALTDLPSVRAIIQVDSSTLRSGDPDWSGSLRKGETIRTSVVCAAPRNASCTFTGGVIAELGGGARVAAPVQVVHRPELAPASAATGVLRTNRLGQSIIETEGITNPK